ncbi:hypothetical protein C8R46DRAFT_1094699 [Mycena filopes]|nr:hypothetical protein C8R46DRAFT_1094699 [Mycena filopes]
MDLAGAISSLHSALEAATSPPGNPYPELLSTCVGPPTDSQATVLWAEIARAEAQILITDTHLHRLRSAVEKLAQYRHKLEDLATTRRGVLSTLRRLPNEILVEIFQYTIIPKGTRPMRAPWVASQVCSRWRGIAVASPVLWRHILSGTNQNPRIAHLLALQVQRVRAVPVSLEFPFRGSPSASALALCLGLSSQWEDLELNISLFTSPPLSDLNFPTLKRLHLHNTTGVFQYSSRHDVLPALQHLTFSVNHRELSRSLSLPWAQLRTCDLDSVYSLDFLWILSQLSGADVSVTEGYGNDDDPQIDEPLTLSVIRYLAIEQCTGEFLYNVFDILSTPALKRLTLQCNDAGTGSLGERVARFLDRSASSLTELHLDNELDEEDQLHILGSPHIRSLVRLDLPSRVLTSQAIALLAVPFPNLRRVTLHGDVDESLLLAALATHNRPVISCGDRSSVVLSEGEMQVVLV